ncbi:MAG: hypothetical protein U5K54_04330 [Cytophagales bacterium]|nr:hypothetical protein [Cytophagales bacterium]
MPFKDLKSIVEQYKADIIVTALTSGPSPTMMQAYLNKLSTEFASTKIFVTGYAVKKVKPGYPANITFFDNSLIFKELLNSSF